MKRILRALFNRPSQDELFLQQMSSILAKAIEDSENSLRKWHRSKI